MQRSSTGLRYVIEARYKDDRRRIVTRRGTAIIPALERVYKGLVPGYPYLASCTELFPCSEPAPEGVWHLYGGKHNATDTGTIVGPLVIASVWTYTPARGKRLP